MSSNIEITKTCRWCGKEFTARKTSTEYCSHRCSGLAYKERKRQAKLEAFKIEYAESKAKCKEDDLSFLIPSQTACLLGVGRATVYRYLATNTSHVDRYFASLAPKEKITEWYTATEIQERFGMTIAALYTLVSKECIPKMKTGGLTEYSKRHFDRAKGIEVESDEPQYYIYPEAMEKYGLTRDQLHHYLKYHNVTRTKKEILTLDEMKALAATPCEIPVLKQAAMFGLYTGLRLSDLLALRWDNIERNPDGGYCIRLCTEKTDNEATLPVSDEALEYCGKPEVGLVFRGFRRSMAQ